MKSLLTSVLETANLYGENTQDLTEDDIIDSIKALVSLAKSMNIIWEGDFTDGNA